MTHHLVSVPEVAQMLGVTRQRVHQIIRENSDFPAPEAALAVGRVWRRDVVEKWLLTHSRRPGRPTGT